MTMRRTVLTLALVLGLVLVACGDDDDTTNTDQGAADVGDDQSPDGDPSDGGSSDGDDGSAGDGSATVALGGETHELTEGEVCDVQSSGSVFVTINEDDDTVSITANDGINLYRMTIDGADWADTGSAESPQISGSDATWSGEMSSEGATEQVTISVSC